MVGLVIIEAYDDAREIFFLHPAVSGKTKITLHLTYSFHLSSHTNLQYHTIHAEKISHPLFFNSFISSICASSICLSSSSWSPSSRCRHCEFRSRRCVFFFSLYSSTFTDWQPVWTI